MTFRGRTPVIFLAVFVLFYASRAWADMIEEPFKEICTKLASLDKQTQAKKIDDPKWREKSRLFRDVLKKLVTASPQSIWADDAQFLVAMLSSVDKTDISEKESFLKKY